jgi:leader peptidase (prepilin peptidase)/N-methyltransferase
MAFALAVAAALAWVPRRLVLAIGEPAPGPWQETALFAVMAIAAALAITLASGPGAPAMAITALAAMCGVAAVYYDLRYMIVPDLVSGGFVLAGLGAAWSTGRWLEHAMGAVLCGGLLAAVAFGFRWIRGRDGLGFGDVKLAAGLGLLIGAENGLWTIAAASLGGAGWAALRTLRQRGAGEAEPAVIPLGALLAFIGSGLYLCRA